VPSSKKAEPEDGPQATSSSISQVFSPSYLDSYPLLSKGFQTLVRVKTRSISFFSKGGGQRKEPQHEC